MGGPYGTTNFLKSERRSRRRESEGDVTMEKRHNRYNVISFEDVGRGLLRGYKLQGNKPSLRAFRKDYNPTNSYFCPVKPVLGF